MGFLELIGLLVCLYYIINIILWIFLDSDIELFIKEKIGKPICKYRDIFISSIYLRIKVIKTRL